MTLEGLEKLGLPQCRLHLLPLPSGDPVLLSGRLNTGDFGRISPDGKRVLAHGHANLPGAKPEWQGATYVIDVATLKATKISGPENQAWSRGMWSPDGRRVAYVWGETHEETTPRRLVVCDADGSKARVILKPEVWVNPVAWR